MEFQKLIEERRTIRKYSPESRITKEDLLAVIRAAQEAPSWKNSQTGRYYCVMSEEMVEKVSRECLPEMNQAKAKNASLIVTTFVHNHAGHPGPEISSTCGGKSLRIPRRKISWVCVPQTSMIRTGGP